jgi:hypothetical protein
MARKATSEAERAEELRAYFERLRQPPGDPVERKVEKLVAMPEDKFQREVKRLKKAARFLGAPSEENPYDQMIERARARRGADHHE